MNIIIWVSTIGILHGIHCVESNLTVWVHPRFLPLRPGRLVIAGERPYFLPGCKASAFPNLDALIVSGMGLRQPCIIRQAKGRFLSSLSSQTVTERFRKSKIICCF